MVAPLRVARKRQFGRRRSRLPGAARWCVPVTLSDMEASAMPVTLA
jgi:hypothetical protein